MRQKLTLTSQKDKEILQILTNFSTFQHILAHISTYQRVLACFGLFQLVLACFSLFQNIIARFSNQHQKIFQKRQSCSKYSEKNCKTLFAYNPPRPSPPPIPGPQCWFTGARVFLPYQYHPSPNWLSRTTATRSFHFSAPICNIVQAGGWGRRGEIFFIAKIFSPNAKITINFKDQFMTIDSKQAITLF